MIINMDTPYAFKTGIITSPLYPYNWNKDNLLKYIYFIMWQYNKNTINLSYIKKTIL